MELFISSLAPPALELLKCYLVENWSVFNHNEVLEYLIQRERIKKFDSLKVIAAHNVARYVENKADVEALEIPGTMRQYLARFVDGEE